MQPGTAPGAASSSSGPVRRARSSSRVCEREVRASSQSRREPAPYGLTGSNVVEGATVVRSSSPNARSGARSRSPSARTAPEHSELATGMRSNSVQPVWVPQVAAATATQQPIAADQSPLSPTGTFEVRWSGGSSSSKYGYFEWPNGI